MDDMEDFLWLKLKLIKFLNEKFLKNEIPPKSLVDVILKGMASQKQQSSPAQEIGEAELAVIMKIAKSGEFGELIDKIVKNLRRQVKAIDSAVNKVLEGFEDFTEDAQAFGIVHSPKGSIQFEKIISNLLKARGPLMDRLDSLQGLFPFSSKNDWVSIFVARECYTRFSESAGRKPTFSGGTDHTGKLEGDFIQLLEEVFNEFDIESSAEHCARGAVADFDHDLNGFKPRKRNKGL